MPGNLVLLDFQKCRDFYVVVGISSHRVESDDIAQLGTVKEFFLVFYFDVLRHQRSTLNGNAAFERIVVLVQLTEVALQHITLFRIESIHLVVVAGTALEHLDLLVNQLVVNGNLIVVNLVLAVQFNLELRCDGNVELELIRSFLFQINTLLGLRGHRLAQHLDFVVGYVFLEILTQDSVDDIHLYLHAVLPLDQAHRHLSRTETGNIGTLAIILERLLDLILVISFLNSDGH